MPPRFLDLVTPRSYSGLLAVLLIVIVVSPLLNAVRLGSRILDVLFVLALLSAIRDIAGEFRRHGWVLGVGAVAVVSRIVSALAHPPPGWLVVTAIGSTIALFVIAIAAISRHVFRSRTVTLDTIRGAICVFLLLGLVWTLSYLVVFAVDREAFPSIDPAGDSTTVYSTLQYFSFVTLTTLGYGDVTPHGLAARQLAMLEAIVGQLFIAVAIAWLVGMYRREDERRGPPSDDSNDHDRS